MSKKTNTAPVRVLIVDNEIRVVELHKKLLTLWGYTPIVAEGIGTALVESAKQKAKDDRCQIALVDMRLADDFNEEDMSGLDLIEQIKPTETIIVSGYGTLRLALEIVQERGAVDFFEKDDDPNNLKNKIDKIARKNCASHNETVIEPDDILQYIEEKLSSSMPKAYNDQIIDILIQLFPGAKKLRLEKIDASEEALLYSTVPRPGSVVLRVYKDNLEPVILKIARSKKIKKEIDRYKEYVEGKLGGNYKPSLKAHAILWDIGGIVFSHVGAVKGTFANFIFQNSLNETKQVLNHFFQDVWKRHYSEAKEITNVSLFKIYTSVLGESWLERAGQCSMPTPTGKMNSQLWEKVRMNDPLAFLEKMKKNKGSQDNPSVVKKTKMAVGHGDLHGDNLLIDESQHGWVIDFERTGPGHALQDFVELEGDIIIRATCAKKSLPDFYHFYLALIQVKSIGEKIEIPSVFNERGDVKKLFSVISSIRELAVVSTRIDDAYQYLLGLYFNAIFRATLKEKAAGETYDKSELRIWMFASILSHRLLHWDDEYWPPDEWDYKQKRGM